MGSKSNSTSQSSYDQRTSNTTIGLELADQALGIVGDGNSVNYLQTDYGAVNAGRDVAVEAMRGIVDASSEAFNFGRDSIDAVAFNASESINAQLEASGLMSDVANSALMTSENFLNESLNFAGNQNELLANTLGDNSMLTQQALLELASNQERSLDNALDVARSVALDDNVEGATEQTKYFALAAGAIGVAIALRGLK